MLPMNLLILSEPKWVEVCDSRWSLWLVLVPCGLGAVVFLVHCGIECLSLCLAHRCFRAPPQVSRGAHEMLSPCENSMRCVLWASFVLCGPREFLTAWPITGLTSFLLGSAVCRCAMSTRSSSLAWHMGTCYACSALLLLCEAEARKLLARHHGSHVVPVVCSFGPRTPTGDVEHVVWWKLGVAYSVQTVLKVSTASDSCSCESG